MLTAIQLSTRRSAGFAKKCSRRLASVSSSVNPNSVGPFQVFDRNIKVLQKDRGAIINNGEKSRTVDYVRNEVAERMIERFMVSVDSAMSECARGAIPELLHRISNESLTLY